MRRVVVTGLGLVTPLGGDVETTWNNLIAGKSGIAAITRFDTTDQKAKIAGEVKPKDHEYGFDPDKRVDHKVQRQVDPFIVYAIDAAGQALEDAGLAEMDDDLKERTGVSIGSGIGGLPGIESESLVLAEKGPGRVSPHFVHGRLINLTSGQVSIKYGLMGPNHSVVTACSTGAHSIGDAARMIKDGDADVMLAGGAESTINPLGVAGFAQARALNTAFNDRPEQASRPYDKNREGFVMGEGAGVVVLEEYEHAKARGAKIYAEVAGYGATSDGHDMVAPSGEGAVRCMKMALEGVNAPVDYINPHATSTPIGDIKEIEAIREVFGAKCPPISATKSLTGHSLGAAGVQEAIYSLLMMQNGFICESANIDNLDPAMDDMPIVRERKDNARLGVVLSNSFGFGGTNASIVFKRLDV
jgi:3-oxoacyl-[acyl-carrier-protein] synthase II